MSSTGLPPVDADPERIGQVLRNLLSNAITHTPDGGRVVVSAHLADTGDVVTVTVQDTGPGIAQEHLEHVFDRFYRADPSRARATVSDDSRKSWSRSRLRPTRAQNDNGRRGAPPAPVAISCRVAATS